MKRYLILPFFLESSILLVVFLLIVNLVSLAEYQYTAIQKQSLKLKVLPSPAGFNIELPHERAK
jgi:hypothetical protein